MKQFVVIFCTALLAGCANNSLKPTDPSRGLARSAQSVQEGVILDVTTVTLKANTQAAQAMGAGLGGYIGNVLTSNDGEAVRVLGTVAGAALGSAAGQAVSDTAMDQTGIELIISVQNRTISVVQQADSRSHFNVGDAVWIVGSGNNIRVLPKSSIDR